MGSAEQRGAAGAFTRGTGSASSCCARCCPVSIPQASTCQGSTGGASSSAPVRNVPEAPHPEHDSPGPGSASPWDDLEASNNRPQQAAPAVAPVSTKPQHRTADQRAAGSDAVLDFAPDAGGHTATAAAAPDLNAERPPHIEASASARTKKQARRSRQPRQEGHPRYPSKSASAQSLRRFSRPQ